MLHTFVDQEATGLLFSTAVIGLALPYTLTAHLTIGTLLKSHLTFSILIISVLVVGKAFSVVSVSLASACCWDLTAVPLALMCTFSLC